MRTPLSRGCLALIFHALALAQTPTSTSLVAAPSPSNYGQPVTLTATVTSGTTGKVTFYDGVTILGVGTLSGGQATISTVMLPSGSRKLRAYYQGDWTYAASSSAVVPQTVVAGASLALKPSVSYPSNGASASVSISDFDGDGRQDLAVLSYGCNCVTVYLGNGDGTFGTGVDYVAASVPVSVAVGDINGDGKNDIVVSNRNSNNISILFGNGDGIFQPAVNLPVIDAPGPIAVVDLNGDGKADLILGSNYNYRLMILLGNGDGTFGSVSFAPIDDLATSLAVADFNGNGKADIAVATPLSGGILLGNGDGTLQSERTVYAYTLDSISTADLDNDDRADIVGYQGYYVQTFLGNGDGTFVSSDLILGVYYQPTSVVLADFDGDGKQDLAVVYRCCAPNFTGLKLLPGNGDGTFGSSVTYPIPSGTNVAAVGDFNGDGKADLVLASGNSAGYSVMLGGAGTALTVASAHPNPVAMLQTVTYTLTVTNSGSEPTSGTVTLIDVPPSGLNVTTASGTGWRCDSTVACTNSTSVSPGQSFPPISVIAYVAATTTGSVTNQVSVSGGGALQANAFDPTLIVGPQITIETYPVGLQFSVDGGTAQAAPQKLYPDPGNHTLAVAPTQFGPGTEYLFSNWSDGNSSSSRTFTVPGNLYDYYAIFHTLYQLTTAASPPNGGTVSPTSGNYYNTVSEPTKVTISATPAPPYVFSSWSGSLAGLPNPTSIIVNTPTTITAIFDIPGATCTMTGDTTASVADVQFIVNEALGNVSANNDLDSDGAVSIADVQKVLNAALNLGCLH